MSESDKPDVKVEEDLDKEDQKSNDKKVVKREGPLRTAGVRKEG